MPTHTPLSKDEIETLKRLAKTLELPDIASRLGRTRGVIIAAAFKAGVTLKTAASRETRNHIR